MKKYLFATLLLTVLYLYTVQNSFSQLPDKNIYLLRNINTHSIPGGNYSAVWGYVAPDGREYAIMGCYDGTLFVDVTDAANIHEVGFVPSPAPGSYYNNWREMKTYSHYCYIVSEIANSGFQIVDLQYLPDSIHYIKKYVPAGYSSTHSISQSGPYLYANGASIGQGVTVYDLTLDPEFPVKRGAYNSFYVHDCRVTDDTIYAANITSGSVSIIDAKNKNSLTLVNVFSNLPGSGPHNTALSADKKYLFVTDEIGTAPYLLKVWNIQDKQNVTYVTNWQPTGITNSIIHNVEVYGNYLFASHYSAGLRILDVSNPEIPTEIAWYDTYPSDNNTGYNGNWGLYMFPSGKIASSDRNTGLYVLKMNFNLKIAIEGLYNSNSNKMNIKDTVTAYLRNVNSPYNIIDSSKEVVNDISLTGNFKFSNALSGKYYIAVKHRNSIETWSRFSGESYDPMTLMSYDFTDSYSKTFGDNSIQVDASPVVFAMYSGDVNQDETVDAGDISLVENGVLNSLTGYKPEDLNGDYFTDASDLSIVMNNSSVNITSVKP
ncbi:MAG TPA: choice-of-anchor B family protein [Ignavibacteria bacterium]|nr:choice-of-anchor B family protein [Ignavibacteria bacterium]